MPRGKSKGAGARKLTWTDKSCQSFDDTKKLLAKGGARVFARAPLFGSMRGAWGKTLGFWVFPPGSGTSHRAHTLQTPPPKGGGLAGAAPVRNLEGIEKAAAEQNAAAPLPPATGNKRGSVGKAATVSGSPRHPHRNRCAPCKQPLCAGSRP